MDQRIVGILIRPFVSIQAGCDIKKVHNSICTDLMELTLEFEDVLRSGDADDIRNLKLRQLVERLCRSENIYPNMIIPLSNPHSCDIERLISACDLLKTPMRNGIDIKLRISICMFISIWKHLSNGTHDLE